MSFPLLGSFVDQLRRNLGGRTDREADLRLWLSQAYRELAMGYPFETLEASIQEATQANVDTYDYPEDARGLKSLVLLNGTSPVTLVKRNIQVVRRLVGTGVPSLWAPFGSQFILRAVPTLVHTLFIDYWMKPIIDVTSNATIDETVVRLPDDWMEILLHAATEKGHLGLVEADKATQIHQLLHGDPRASKAQPGIIKERMDRNASESSLSNYGLRPRMRRYTS